MNIPREDKSKPSAAIVLDFMAPKKAPDEEMMEGGEDDEAGESSMDADAMISDIQARLDKLRGCMGSGAY